VPSVKDRWDTGRVEAFSDGVFSVAATLLVLEISVPAADFDHLWKGIGDQWPSYLAWRPASSPSPASGSRTTPPAFSSPVSPGPK
jgi:transmembrane protein TMEM174 (potassium channel)